MKLFHKILCILFIYVSVTQNLYAFKTDHQNYIRLKQSGKFYNKSDQFYENSFIKRNKNYKYEFGFSAHLFYPKASLEKLFETSFGFGVSVSYRIYPKLNTGIYLSYTPLVPILKYSESGTIQSAHILNSSLLLKYGITQEIFLNLKLGYLYYSVTRDTFNNEQETENSSILPQGIKTGTWCPVISLGPSMLFTWTKNISFMLDLNYDTFYLEASYKYYFLAKITISFVK